MERKNRKKRSIGNSMLSLMLVLALVISNIQIMPGTVSAVWASESPKTQSTDISDETSEAADTDNEQEDIENSAGGLEEAATETSAFRESESAATDDDSKTEISETETSETATETDTNELESEENTKTEAVTEAVETETVEEETATEESDGKLLNEEEESGSDDSKIGEQVEVIIHFKNSLGWGSVLAHYANHNGTNWASDGTSWPGIEQKKDENGYYTLKMEKSKDSGFAFLFHNNSGGKTQDIIIPSDEFTESTYELWVWIDGEIQENGENKKKAILSKTEIISPEVGADRKVTFRYKNDSAMSVKVAGSMTEWDKNPVEMGKDSKGNFFSEMLLAPGEYTYKFIVDGNWIQDPNNLISIRENESSNNYNSGLYVPSTETYQYTIHYYNPDAEESKTPDLHVWDKSIDNSWAYPAASKDFSFDSSKTDAEGRKWWTATFTVPYQYLGFMGRVNAGSYTEGQDDKDREYKIESGSEVELWYVHGTGENSGVHTENPFPVQEGLNPPELTVAKGTTTTLPAKLTKGAQDGTAVEVDVTYTMEAEVAGVTLDDTEKQLTIAKDFAGTSVELTATETGGLATVTFEIKVVEDKNKITIKLHYYRPDGDYENWNVWAWSQGTEGQGGARYDFKEENGERVATITLDGRKNSRLGFKIRKSGEIDDWEESDIDENRFIDLQDILSGTIDCFVTENTFDFRTEFGDDILKGTKICELEYEKETNSIKVITGKAIDGDLNTVFALKRSDNTKIGIKNVTKSGQKEYTIEPEENLGSIPAIIITKDYLVSFDGYDYKFQSFSEPIRTLYSTQEFEDEFTYTGNDLGATWTPEKTTFKVWAPTADKVEVKIHTEGEVGKGSVIQTIPMIKGDKGVWSAEAMGNYNDLYYTYAVTINGETTEACDPYARTTGVNGDRAMVLNLDITDPEGWEEDVSPNAGMSYTDSVIYELHVRDFSIDESSGIKKEWQGKFLGLTQEGTTNQTGQTTGLDYLKDLGVTHIHLLPSYDYATVDETKLDTPQYNWGYDPKNYNVPEGSYSTDPYDGRTRVMEMKQMVKTLHDNNINVIMDVVYNHVYDADQFCFNQIVPQYFSRTTEDGSYSNGSGCGNDTASERAMVKKYIVDSVNYWADEYHIDGFRFDLVGLLDTETINEVVDTVHKKHPNVVFYGEGWDMSTEMSKDGYTMATQQNASKTPTFAYFSDTIRDLLKGGNNETDLGFVSGLTGKEEPMANCFRSLAGWSSTPTQIVNYASCHDNYTLKDKLDVTAGNIETNTPEDIIKMNNLAAAIYLTAQGIPLIHAGEEILREKKYKDEDGNIKIDHNSYKSPDSVNSIKWYNLDKEEYRQTRDYYKGLIAFRKNHAALRLTTAEAVAQNVKYHWITNEVIMFVINGKEQIAGEASDGIVVIFNATKSAKEVDLYRKNDQNNSMYGIAEGTWNVCVNAEKAGTEILDTITDGKVQIAPISAMILVKGEDEGSSDDEALQKKLQELKELIGKNENLQQGNYTDESWAVFETALKEAQTVAVKENVTIEEIDAAAAKLQAAVSGLAIQEGKVDFEPLRVLVNQYKDLKREDYTDESWAVFETALKAAQALLDTEVTQEEIDAAKAALEQAREKLVEAGAAPVEKQELKELVERHQKTLEQGQGNYTDESWQAFQTALSAAQAVLAKTDATQQEVDQAVEDLAKAYDRLEVPEGVIDTRKLKELVDTSKLIQDQGQGDYTDESWTAFTTALSEAEAVLKNQQATQTDIDNARSKLEKARTGLVKNLDTEALDELIAECDRVEKGDYTDESWKLFTDALAAAKATIANPKATQEEIHDAEQKLRVAYKGLKVPEGTVDKGKLKALVAKYKAFVDQGQGDYTNESWKAFLNALSEAESVLAKEKATQEEIDAAAEKLEKEHSNLVVIKKEGFWTEWLLDSGLSLGSDGKYHIPYTGKALKPEISVYDGKTLLREKTDYTISYQNNTNAGVATVTIKGKGNYSEVHPEEFIIDAIDIASIDIADLYEAVAPNNTKQIVPKPVLKLNGTTLKLNKDYTAEYENPQTDGKTPNEEGKSYNVIVKAKSTNFTGSQTIHMTLVDKNNVFLMSKASIGKIAKEDMVYTGKVLEPQITVKYGKTTLAKDTDYTVLYDNEHIEAGETATITIRGNGKTYVGQKTISFKITGTPLKANQITIDVPKSGVEYTGAPQRPEVSITGMNQEEMDRCVVITYQNSTDVGTATVIVTGKNGYSGTVKKTFKITAFDISANRDQKFTYNKDANNAISAKVPFAKGGSKLTDDQTGARFTISDGVEIALQQGKDYTLSYKNNKKVGDNTASVTIKGKGNFKGTLKNIPFTIVAQDLSNLNITAADVLQKNAKKFNKVVPVVTDLDGKTLKNKTDFELDTATAYTDEAGNPISSTEPATGTAIKVTVTGKGNYQGTASAIFHIIDNNMSIAKATVQIEPQRYTGSEVTLSNDQIHVKLKINGTITELQNDNFQIVGYSKNIKKGTAKVTIRGIYPYGGTKTVNFKITARPMN